MKFLDMYFGNPSPDYMAKANLHEMAMEKRLSGAASSTKRPSPSSPSLSLESYEGNYTNDIYININTARSRDS
jgi:hypothetical protein